MKLVRKRLVHWLPLLLNIYLQILFSSLNAQNISFSGQIKDSVGLKLHGANILLVDTNKKKPPSFGTTDFNGYFDIKVYPNTEYDLLISFIGFESVKKIINVKSDDITSSFVLKEAINRLNEVVINYKPPLQVKKDTLIYQADSFASGKERKIRQVLEKLPGVEVTRKGEVLVNNQKVTQLLVEGKKFFNGQTKMGIDNIPADVVQEIQVIDDYHETYFLKGFTDSEELAMNLVLKEDKKEFLFGDIESSVGYDDRYSLHPSLFKYTPKNALNVLGDANNTSSRSFTLSDFLASSISEPNPEEFVRLLRSPLGQFLTNDNYFDNDHLFFGVNNQWNPSEKDEIRFFSALLDDRSKNAQRNERVYLTNESFELRSINQESDQSIFTGILEYRSTPKKDIDIKFSTQFDRSDLLRYQLNGTQIENSGESEGYTNRNSGKENKLMLSFDVAKFFSDKNSAQAKLAVSLRKSEISQQWVSVNNIFTDQLDLKSDSLLTVVDLRKDDILSIDFEVEDYHRLTPTTLLTLGINGNSLIQSLDYAAEQLESDGTLIPLNGFVDSIRGNFNDLNTSMGVKQLLGNFTLQAGMNYQYAYWKDIFQEGSNSTTFTNFAPDLQIKWEPRPRKIIRLQYNKSWLFPDMEQRYPGLILRDFNTVLNGNPILDQVQTENLLFSFSSSKTYGLSYYGTIRLNLSRDRIVNQFIFQGINGFIQPFNSSVNFQRVNATGRLRYSRPLWILSKGIDWNETRNPVVYNGIQAFNTSSTLSSRLNFETMFEHFPNVELTLSNRFNRSTTETFRNNSYVLDINTFLEYSVGNWRFEGNYDYTIFTNTTSGNSFNYNQLNSAIYFHEINSPWEFGVQVTNMGNSKRLVTNSSTPQVFTEYSQNLFPRVILAMVNYKL